MPVADHPTHPSTVIGPDHRYGCWNRPVRFAASYQAPQRSYQPDGRFETGLVEIPFRMSHECHYDSVEALGIDDPACAGCKRKAKS